MAQLNEKWEQLDPRLHPEVEKALINALNFPNMMPVQKACIPLFIKNYDVAVEAQTGSGKTLSFLLPLLHILIKNVQKPKKHNLYALVIAPTRELAMQIHEICEKLLQSLQNVQQFSLQLLIGGHSTQIDIENLEKNGCNIIVGSPGKLKELFSLNSEWLTIKNLEILIMDEADRLMDNDYYDDMQEILQKLPKQRRTGLFSATLSSTKLKDLIKVGMRNPVKISIKPGGDKIDNQNYIVPNTLTNEYFIVQNRFEKIGFLINFLSLYQSEKIIVFLNTCASVDFYQKIFKQFPLTKKFLIMSIHGQMKQNKRTKIIQEFSKTKSGILFCTDVVARGIDFENVGYILQLDPPQDPSYFIHRIGRTARKGNTGKAIILIEQHEESFLNFLRLKKVEINQYKNENQIEVDPIKYENQMIDTITLDRDNIEKSKKAFISYIRSYKEHDLKYIFQYKNLDIGWVARSFFLLRLPRIKEILGKKIENFKQNDEIDINEIQFQDKNQQSQFSKKEQQREIERIEREKRIQKEQEQHEKKMKEKNMRQVRRKQKRENIELEQDEFEEELRLVKKLKQGKITLKQYQERIKELEPEELHDVQLSKKQILSVSGHKKSKK